MRHKEMLYLIKKILKRILNKTYFVVLYPKMLFLFLRDYVAYSKLASGSWVIRLKEIKPILFDRIEQAGCVDPHYFNQDIWAAKKILDKNPQRHIDIGSRLDGFIAHLLVFRNVDFVDIRPLPHKIKGLNFVQDDATKLASFADQSVESISTLHAVEHFGLGRYGDPIDPMAAELFCKSLQRVLKKDGRLYLSTPCGIERVQFNAHRVFDVDTILSYFNELELVSFSAVKDDGTFYENISPEQLKQSRYACGMFEFTRR
jgi:SAM-dependent methyltransferase